MDLGQIKAHGGELIILTQNGSLVTRLYRKLGQLGWALDGYMIKTRLFLYQKKKKRKEMRYTRMNFDPIVLDFFKNLFYIKKKSV